MRAGYAFTKNWQIALDVINLFDKQVSDIDYFYESQLPGEIAPVADIHTHPAIPRTYRLVLTARF
jgi:outer membrane receptor protein involved in Fe transport